MKIAAQEIETFCPTNRQHWRAWLEEHHANKQAVWLIYHKKKSPSPTLTWSEAVDEALCFGWIDSRAQSIDEHTYRQFFSRRKPNSVWSKVNKDKVKQLIDEGKMTEAGLRSIEIARQNGSWASLDDVDALVIPPDLAQAFQNRPTAEHYFLTLSRSDRRALLQWIILAKQLTTRQKRIAELVERADQHLKPAWLQGTKKQGASNS
jgi:uncharacterized protein YdeI (YjbR/CyaY-like superfamily)